MQRKWRVEEHNTVSGRNWPLPLWFRAGIEGAKTSCVVLAETARNRGRYSCAESGYEAFSPLLHFSTSKPSQINQARPQIVSIYF